MNNLKNEIHRLKNTDAIHEVEKITGKSYKEDKTTDALGMMMFFEKNRNLKELIAKADDTQFSSTVSEYLRITGKFGFEVVYEELFEGRYGQDKMYVLFHKELGIIICFDTFGWGRKEEPTVNGGSMYYNWSPNQGHRSNLTSSGHFVWEKDKHIAIFEQDMKTRYIIADYPQSPSWDLNDESWTEYQQRAKPIDEKRKMMYEKALSENRMVLWSGYHDCREAVINTIQVLMDNGKFFPVWQDCPFLWLTHYGDHEVNRSMNDFTPLKDLTKQRIEKMPDTVKQCINGTY